MSTVVADGLHFLRARAAFASILLVSLVLVAAYLASWRQLAAIWSDGESRYSHGWLVVAAALFVLYTRLPTDVTWSLPRARWTGVVAGLFASALWLLGGALTFESVQQASALLVLMSGLFAVFGLPISRVALQSVGALGLAVPIWDPTGVLFQQLTIAVVGVVLRSIGLPIEMVGSVAVLPSGTFQIGETCNGLQLFLAAVITGSLLSALRGDAWWDTLKIVGGAAAIGLFANWVRVSIVVAAGHATNMQSYLVKQEHYTLGWAVFAAGMGLYLYWVNRWPVRSSDADAPLALRSPRNSAAVAACLGTLVAAPLVSAITSREQPLDAVVESLEFVAPDWRGPLESTVHWKVPASPGARFGHADYVAPAGKPRVSVLVEAYDSPSDLPDAGAARLGFGGPASSLGTRRLPRPGGGEIAARRTIVQDAAGRNWLLIDWFEVANRTFASSASARIRLVFARLRSSDAKARLALFGTPCATDCSAEEESVVRLAAEAGPHLLAQLARSDE